MERSSSRRAVIRTATGTAMPGGGALGGLLDGLLQQPAAQLGGAVAVLGDAQELGRGEQHALRGAPARLGGDGGDRPVARTTTGWCSSANSPSCSAARSRVASSGLPYDLRLHLRRVQLDAALARRPWRGTSRGRRCASARPRRCRARRRRRRWRRRPGPRCRRCGTAGRGSAAAGRRSRGCGARARCGRGCRRRDQRGELVAAEPGRGVAGRTASWSLRAAWTRSSSPAWWPTVSLTALKPSRSMKSTAVPRSPARRPPSAWPTRSVNRARLGRSVSGSC